MSVGSLTLTLTLILCVICVTPTQSFCLRAVPQPALRRASPARLMRATPPPRLTLTDETPQPTAVEVADPSSVEPSTMQRLRETLGKWRKMDKASALAKAGSNFFFAYGFISNVNAGCTIALAWGAFTRSSGLSPFAPGQWSKFLAVYLSIYLTLGTALRPFRLALGVWITPRFDRVVKAQQARLPFAQTRPRLNRSLALLIVSLLGNMFAMLVVTTSGIWLGSLLTGVPVFPPGFQFVRK